jgi:hypothetical protein
MGDYLPYASEPSESAPYHFSIQNGQEAQATLLLSTCVRGPLKTASRKRALRPKTAPTAASPKVARANPAPFPKTEPWKSAFAEECADEAGAAWQEGFEVVLNLIPSYTSPFAPKKNPHLTRGKCLSLNFSFRTQSSHSR